MPSLARPRWTTLRGMESKPAYVRLARNCWLPADVADDLTQQCLAVLRSSHPDAVISSTTAAALHRLWLPPSATGGIHVATASPGRAGRGMTRTKRPEFVAHRIQLRPEDTDVVDGVHVTSRARTWRDLAPQLSLPDLVALGDSVLRQGTPLEELAEMAARARGRGVRLLRLALPLLDARSRSRPESHLRVAVRLTGLGDFQVNEPIFRREGGWLAEPDLSLPQARLALEYQGADHAELGRMRRDITRERDMRLEGWQTLYFGPAEVFGRPGSVGSEVYAAVRARAPELLPARRQSAYVPRPSRRRSA